MTHGYKQLMDRIPVREVPQGLADAVMLRIERYEVRRLQTRAAIHGFFLVVAVALCVPAIQYVITAISQSGFSGYASLILSDSGYVLSHWKEFTMLIADAVPVTGGIALVCLALVLVSSLRSLASYLSSLSAHSTRSLA